MKATERLLPGRAARQRAAARLRSRTVAIGMAHLGVGAFHRCHQAEFTDDMLERRFGSWGVVGVNLRPPRIGPCSAFRTACSPAACTRTAPSPSAARSAASAPWSTPRSISIGPSRPSPIPGSGRDHDGDRERLLPCAGDRPLDEANPDIVHDLAQPHAPRSLPGFLLEALARRRARPGGPLTLISCDNIPANGAVLRGVVQALAERGPRSRALDQRPRSLPLDHGGPHRARHHRDRPGWLAAAIGCEDRAGVVGEPFRQWVIEDRFAGPRPPWIWRVRTSRPTSPAMNSSRCAYSTGRSRPFARWAPSSASTPPSRTLAIPCWTGSSGVCWRTRPPRPSPPYPAWRRSPISTFRWPACATRLSGIPTIRSRPSRRRSFSACSIRCATASARDGRSTSWPARWPDLWCISPRPRRASARIGFRATLSRGSCGHRRQHRAGSRTPGSACPVAVGDLRERSARGARRRRGDHAACRRSPLPRSAALSRQRCRPRCSALRASRPAPTDRDAIAWSAGRPIETRSSCPISCPGKARSEGTVPR